MQKGLGLEARLREVPLHQDGIDDLAPRIPQVFTADDWGQSGPVSHRSTGSERNSGNSILGFIGIAAPGPEFDQVGDIWVARCSSRGNSKSAGERSERLGCADV